MPVSQPPLANPEKPCLLPGKRAGPTSAADLDSLQTHYPTLLFSALYMLPFSPFFLLMGGLLLSLPAQAQAGPSVVGSPAGMAVAALAVSAPAPHSSQLPHEESRPVPALAGASEAAATPPAPPSPVGIAAVAASKSQLLLVLLETIQTQQARLDALQTEAEATIRRANRAEAVTTAFEQRLRQLESATNRPGFRH